MPLGYYSWLTKQLTTCHRDWKKLTFYYFADSYINFNSLVTDLFKIYKTRIWMSAINPASFITPPTAGPQPPNGVYGKEVQTDRRHQYDGRGYDPSRDGMSTPLSSFRNAFTDPFQPFGQPSRQLDLGGGIVAPSPQPQLDVFAPYNAYGRFDPSYLDGSLASGPPVHPDWVNRFHGLSLGS